MRKDYPELTISYCSFFLVLVSITAYYFLLVFFLVLVSVTAESSVPVYPMPSCRSGSRSIADPLGKARSASLRRESAPYGYSPLPSSSNKSVSPLPVVFGGWDPVGDLVQHGSAEVQQQIAVPFPDLPPELQGVSVKDLVKALGTYG